MSLARCRVRREAATEDEGYDALLGGRTYYAFQGRWYVSLGHWWNDDWEGNTEELGENYASVPLSQPQIPHEMRFPWWEAMVRPIQMWLSTFWNEIILIPPSYLCVHDHSSQYFALCWFVCVGVCTELLWQSTRLKSKHLHTEPWPVFTVSVAVEAASNWKYRGYLSSSRYMHLTGNWEHVIIVTSVLTVKMVKLFLGLTKYDAMKTYWGMEL
jgi:hypothetical protein